MKMEYYKKITEDDILILFLTNGKDYSIASKNDPQPDGCTDFTWEGKKGFEQITAEEASAILGWDVTE